MSQDNKDTQGASTEAAGTPKRSLNGWMVFGVLILAIYFINYRPDIETVECDAERLATKPDVIMLGTWWCPYCAEARRYFHDNDVSYCEYDIERSEEGKKRYAEVNGRGIPVLIFGEKYRYEGFDKRIVERALSLLEEDRSIDDQ